jgi:hypothetical protein
LDSVVPDPEEVGEQPACALPEPVLEAVPELELPDPEFEALEPDPELESSRRLITGRSESLADAVELSAFERSGRAVSGLLLSTTVFDWRIFFGAITGFGAAIALYCP